MTWWPKCWPRFAPEMLMPSIRAGKSPEPWQPILEVAWQAERTNHIASPPFLWTLRGWGAHFKTITGLQVWHWVISSYSDNIKPSYPCLLPLVRISASSGTRIDHYLVAPDAGRGCILQHLIPQVSPNHSRVLLYQTISESTGPGLVLGKIGKKGTPQNAWVFYGFLL